jgi:hypothetical protein
MEQMYSCTMTSNRNLAFDSKRFLAELANLQDGSGAVERFQKRYPTLFDLTAASAIARHWARSVEEDQHDFCASEIEMVRTYWLVPLRDTLREIWQCSDLRGKRWGIFQILEQFFAYIDPRFDKAPVASSERFYRPKTLSASNDFEESLFRLLELASLTRKCANPECDAPYYFAKRRSQKYCDPACAKPAQREFKRNWWAREGERWRAARRNQRPPRQGVRGKGRKLR